jgi:alpha-tubulin suppressor-like RCC1 family protein
VPSTLLNGVVELPLDLEIVVQPQQISAGLGTSAKLAVFADGTSPLSYQWQFCGINLPGQTASTLIFTNTQPTQSGFYSVIVSNASGSITSAPVLLSVAGIATWGEPDSRAAVPPGLTNVVAIAAGAYFDLALSADGTVAAWGENWQNPLDVPPDLTNAIAIAAGTYHGLALRADGTVVSWGSTDVPAPVDLTNVVAIDAGDNNNLALKADGTVVAWNNSRFWSSVAPASLTNIVAISAAGEYDIALEADGTVVEWNDATGELFSPPAGLTNIVAISASDSGNLVLRADGTVTGWSRGWDWMRVLDIPADLTNVVAISAKGNHGLAIIADGTAVAAWGTNLWGEGNVPAGLPNVVAVAGGVGHSMALLRDGSPAMTVQPWDRAVRVGTSASLEAKVVGKLSMQYQWQLNGEDIVGATSDTYNITNVQAADSGVYTLAVSNQVGAIASREAKLIVVSGGSGNINHAPVLPTLADWSINESTQFVVTNAATDPDGAGQALTYELVNAPTGATIDSNGVIRWTPDQAQGSSAVMITTVVTDNGTPSLSATNRFTVIVNGPYYGIDLADWAQALTDTNRNGLCNLLEFALGLNPHNPMTDNSALAVAVSAEGGTNYLAMTYRQRIIAGPLPLQYVPEVSPDRLTWYSGNEDLQTVNTSPLNAQFESVTVRDLLPISPTAPRFMRLRVLSAAAEALSPVWIGTDTVIKGNTGAGSQLSLFSQQMVLPIQYAGKAGALNNTELTDFNASWVDEQFGTNGLRSYVEFDNGRMLDIADSAAANRTLKLADSFGGISLSGDAYRIRAHATVASLFGNNNETGLMAGPNPSRADNVLLLLPKTQRTITLFYYSNPTFTTWQGWVRADDFAPAGNEVVYPEQGVMVRRNLPGDIHLYLCGLVRTEPMVVSVQQGYNLVGAGSSTRTLTLSQLGMFTGNSTTGIAGGLNPAVGDNLVVVQPDNSITTYFYYYWPGVYQGWVNAGNFIVSDDVLIAPGSAFFLNRQAPGAFTWTIPAQ